MTVHRIAAAVLALLLLAGCSAAPTTPTPSHAGSVTPSLETTPVDSGGTARGNLFGSGT